jgi:hypothetical protein
MSAPAIEPNGRLDRIKAGTKSITIQTEFFSNPAWRIEAKVYVDGALKKLENVPLDGTPEEDLQRRIDEVHQKITSDLAAKLRSQQDGRSA